MIEALRIEGLAIVEHAELEFGPGLNVLTGETGAGKSIVLGALALLAGGRASPDLLRAGVDEAVVEAIFRTERLRDLEGELARRDLVVNDHELVVRRTVSRNGRSRARIGGEVVPVSTLAELFRGRLEISSQHETQQLLRADSHVRLLDSAGGYARLVEAVATGSERLRRIDAEMAELREQTEERAQREDFLSFQVGEIDEAKLVPGEGTRLEVERVRLAHAEKLHDEARTAAALLAGDPAAGDARGAADLLAEAGRRLSEIAAIDAGLGELADRLRDAEAEVSDAAHELEAYADGIEADPARLAQVEERLHTLERLRHKYGADETEILARRDAIAGELARIEGADESLSALEAERGQAVAKLAAEARRLSTARRKAARALGGAVSALLPGLALEGARFEAALEPLEPGEGLPSGPRGLESVDFRFSAHAGETPRPLRRVASGGELSRVFLALKSALREADTGMTLVFDEVDAGIGGAVADRVGQVLSELARHHQVLCITHLPQIAAHADPHFRVEREEDGAGRPVTEVRRLGDRERVDEIARMAGGDRVTAATRRHARELLARASQVST